MKIAEAVGDIEVIRPPSPELSIDELLERRKRDFQRRQDYETGRKLVTVNVKVTGPIGILHFGDPHIDDDGADVAALHNHSDLVRKTKGLFAANIGDTTNNWIGRLARLYAQQGTTARDAWKLAEWFIGRQKGKWLYMVGGNHDAWSGEGDPLVWIAEQAQALYESSEVRLAVKFPNGKTVTINARHDFKGNSQWNPTHGPMKAAQLGLRDDIVICGHKHISGYSPLKDPDTGKVCHCLQVASYKIYDRYARENGFRDQSLSPCVVTIIDPKATKAVNLIQVFWEPERAVDYLQFLRKRK